MTPAVATAPKQSQSKAATASRPGAFAGNLLRVDLTRRKCWAEPWGPERMRAELGGVGLGAMILYRETAAKGGKKNVAWDHPDNRLVLGTGPLAGLPVWGTGGLTVCTIGPGSWGAYIANFTFMVGVAAASVMLVIPAYIYRNKDMHDVVLYGELLAVAAIVMSLLFVIVDLGRPDRFWHLIPGIGVFNFPGSMLSWDVVVLTGYLLINLHICGYLLYMKYLGKEPTPSFYVPVVLLSIVWAISIHTVTAFLYVGLVGRPFWNAAIIAPRFLGSAFTAGPAILILTFQILQHVAGIRVTDKAINLLRQIVTASLLINLFLLFCEVFKEFYSDSLHNSSATYLFLGLHGHAALVPWIWTAVGMEIAAAVLLVVPRLARHRIALNVACALSIVGIWIEKGMGMVIPGFIPTPLGDIVEYTPSLNETLVCAGIWSFGVLLYSWMLRIAIPIIKGQFTSEYPQLEPKPVALQGGVV